MFKSNVILKILICSAIIIVLLGSCNLHKKLNQQNSYCGGFEIAKTQSASVIKKVRIKQNSLLAINSKQQMELFNDSSQIDTKIITLIKAQIPKKVLAKRLASEYIKIKKNIPLSHHPAAKNGEALRGLLTFLFFFAIMVGIFLLLNHFLLHLTLQEILKGLLIIVIAVIVIALLAVLSSY